MRVSAVVTPLCGASQASERSGLWTRSGGSKQRPRKFLEYPSKMPYNEEGGAQWLCLMSA